VRANAGPLNVLREAVVRTHFYNPLLPEMGPTGSRGLYTAHLPGTQARRELALALAVRAMLFLGEGDADEAWADVLTCYRLGRQTGRGGTLIEGLVGMAIEHTACRAAVAFLAHGPQDAHRLERCQRDLLALPAANSVADLLLTDRFALLDTFMQIDKQGLDFLHAAADKEVDAGPLAEFILGGADWDPALRATNDGSTA
jgi:hypothetical protein